MELSPSATRSAPPQVVVGTAGHVDHGKSSLVRMLTGTDPDRLPEEKARGMTIDLGFAFLPGAGQGEEVDLAFIDCPGHERFIHHMVAGAGSIDGCLLVIAANEGAGLQTHEHLQVLKLLSIAWGRVVLSKVDMVDSARLAAVSAEVAELSAGTPLALHPPLPVSVRSGQGIDELRAWLFAQARQRRSADLGDYARLPIDRVFTVAGHGTVVTGTLLAGSIATGDTLELYPGGLVRVRTLQVNRMMVECACAGQRTAVNLAGIERAAVSRGSWLASPGSQTATTRADARLQVLAPGLRNRQRVEVHHGTAVVAGEVILLHADAADAGIHDAQLRLAAPLHLRQQDRLILRRPSPSATLAGATVVDAAPQRHRRHSASAAKHFSAALGAGVDQLLAHVDGLRPLPISEPALVTWAGGRSRAEQLLSAAARRMVQRRCGQTAWWWSAPGWSAAGEQLIAVLAGKLAKQPERCWWGAVGLIAEVWPGLPREIGDDLLAAAIAGGPLVRRGSMVTMPSCIPPFPAILLAEARRLLDAYRRAGLQPPYDHPVIALGAQAKNAERALAALRERGWLLRLSDTQHLDRQAGQALIAEVVRHSAVGELDLLHWLKQDHGLTRKHAFPLCSWLDALAITKRVGEKRTLGKYRTLPIPALGTSPL